MCSRGCGAEQQSGASGVARGDRRAARLAQGEAGGSLRRRAGATSDGASFVAEAKEKGAVAVVVAASRCRSTVPVFQVPNARARRCALIAANFYSKPASELTLLGVTGTNGKTTTT